MPFLPPLPSLPSLSSPLPLPLPSLSSPLPSSSSLLSPPSLLPLQFELIRNQDGYKLLLPIVHDPIKNETFVTKSHNAYLLQAHQYVDTILRKTVVDPQTSPGEITSCDASV